MTLAAARLRLRNAAVALPGVDPPTLSNLLFGFEADGTLFQDSAGSTAVASNGDPVGKWNDRSGNGWHFTQATSGKRPTWHTGGPNGKPYVQGDGVDDSLITASIAGWTGGVTTLAVMKASAASTSQYIYDALNARSIIAGFEAAMVENYSAASPRVNMGTFDTTNWAVYEFYDNSTAGAPGTTAQGLKNGTSVESVSGFNTAVPTTTHWLFGAQGASNFCTFQLAALFVFTEGKSSTDRSNMRTWLGAKYGITVV